MLLFFLVAIRSSKDALHNLHHALLLWLGIWYTALSEPPLIEHQLCARPAWGGDGHRSLEYCVPDLSESQISLIIG